MKIENVIFEERDTPYGKQAGLIMPGGYWVMKITFLDTHAFVIENWSTIDWSVKQTAKNMVGRAHWGAPSERGLIQGMGRCIRFFAEHDMLPHQVTLARKRNGEPYKGGRRLYVLASTVQKVGRPAPSARAPKKVGSIDPRNIRIDRVLLLSTA